MTLVGLGRLAALVYRDAAGARFQLRPEGQRWLAWSHADRALVVAEPGPRGAIARLDADAARRHTTFHGAAPARAVVIAMPLPGAGYRCLGRCESVTYCAKGWASPVKRDFRWLHQFGDGGEDGGHGPLDPAAPSTQADRLMPALYTDRRGGLFIVRQPGNRYTVSDWIWR